MLNNFDLMAASRRWPAKSMGERFTLLTLVTYAGRNADGEWTCWPGVDQLATDTLQHPGTVRRHLKTFEKVGLIETRRRALTEGRGRKADEIVLDVELLTKRAPGAVETSDQARTGDGSSAPESTFKRASGPSAHYMEEPTELPTEGPPPSASDGDPVEELCTHLADRIEQHRGARPKITAAWQRDMRLLVERGALHVERPEPLFPGKVRTAIDAVFDDLATPDGRRFCWADQIRSPGALRDHYVQLSLAWRRAKEGGLSRGAQAVDRVVARAGASHAPSSPAAAREPLGLLPPEPKEDLTA